MIDLTFEQAFPVARQMAHQKAVVCVRRCAPEPLDVDELESRLLMIAWRRFDRYDAERASLRTFLSRVMDHEIASALRECGRAVQPEPLSEAAEVFAAVDDTARREFWIDLERALVPLAPEVRETARLLADVQPAEVGRALGCSRGTVWARIRELRGALLGAGIGPNYFALAGGAR